MNPYDFYVTPEEYQRAAAIGVSSANLDRRIRSLGWKKERAISTPIRQATDRKRWWSIAKQNGIPYSNFINRVNGLGWSEERAATEPLENPEQRKARAMLALEKGGAGKRIPKQIIDEAKSNGIGYATLRYRILRGWSVEVAVSLPALNPSEIGRLGAAALRKREGDWAATLFQKKTTKAN
ncbi:hypothetical protein [Paenibacillus humicus]|uniref:hypothetical protein n=1 Tax=Paenibacillus humicus TaxID=412861 RepID=UPI003F17969A